MRVVGCELFWSRLAGNSWLIYTTVVYIRHYLANIHNGGVHKEPYVAYVHSGGVHKTTFRHCVHSGGVNILCLLKRL